MDNKTAQQLIETTFNHSFDEEQFKHFIKNLLNDVESKENIYSGNLIWDNFKDHVSNYKRIFKYTDPKGEQLDVLIVKVRTREKLERARTALRNFVIKHLDRFEKDYALVAFYTDEDNGADWRFSFVKLDYGAVLDNDGKVKIKREFTPAKRYSFLVGENEKSHTAQRQLIPLLQDINKNPFIEKQSDSDNSIENAFSIEKVTDEFFKQYRDLYITLYEYFEKDQLLKEQLEIAGTDTVRFTKKLLGQIVFLYFLQKKGWLGVPKNERWGTGNKYFIQQIFNQAREEGTNFFKDKLQYLFYEALALKRDEINSYYPRFNCRIPFLNGGLFEAEYDWQNLNIELPETLFRNKEQNKVGDEGTGVLDVFDRYNFTIKEDEPLDKEVAVDPEMLGKVFENMLEITERKSKGAFYTPREIVHYMCQESLINYLDNSLNDYATTYQPLGSNQLDMFGCTTDKKNNLLLEEEHQHGISVPKEDIETYIREGHLALENDERVAQKGEETKTYSYVLPESIRNNADKIDQYLSNIKILDPAIGSGAFPVGLLHELVNAMLVLRPHLSYDYHTQKLKGFGFEYRENINESRYIYRLKRHIIQESIYGVDIDASAIDIARLRLWLSLIVDEDDLDPIETLPNLDYKIVCGNSLIGMPETAMRDLEIEAELEELKDRFYHSTDNDVKRELRQQINSKIRELLDSVEQFAGYKIGFDFKLYFSEVWRKNDGFDITIGNPPFGGKLSSQEKAFMKNEYNNVHMRTPDTFNYFISKNHRLLHAKGVISFIVPNNLFFQSEYEKTRKLLLTDSQFHIGINLGDGVFNTATVPSCIFLAVKKNQDRDKYQYADLRKVDKKHLNFKTEFSSELVSITLQTPASVFGITKEQFYLIEKLKASSVTIDDIAEEMASGISTGGDKVFRVSNELVEEQNFEKEIVKPVLVGGDIDKYCLNYKNQSLIYTNRSIDIGNYINIKKYLFSHKDRLDRRSETRAGSLPWYSLGRQRYPLLFEEDKIILRQTSDSIKATLDTNKYYVLNSILVFKNKSTEFTYPLILASLNSSVNAFLYSKFSQEGGRTFAEVKPNNVRKLFVPKANKTEQLICKHLVDYLLFWNTVNEKGSSIARFFEMVIDAVVFQLFLPEEFYSANKDIIKNLNNLKELDDKMTNEEKLAIIKAQFNKLFDPNSEVRYILETLDSIKEVRIIREALR